MERKTLLAEESRYAAGVLSNAQIVKQQEALAQLEQNYSTALLNYSLARLELLRTMGREETAWGGTMDIKNAVLRCCCLYSAY